MSQKPSPSITPFSATATSRLPSPGLTTAQMWPTAACNGPPHDVTVEEVA